MIGLTRREFCGALTSAAMAAPGPNWPDRLGVMCQLGNSEVNARKVLAAAGEAGFRRTQIAFAWNEVNDAFLRGLPSWVKAEKLLCEALGAYVNCARPSTLLMNTRAEDFARAVDYAGELDCHRLVAWTGSYDADLMKSDPRNFTRDSEDAILRFLEPQMVRLEKAKLQVALETYVTLVCPDAPSLRRVLDRLPPLVGAVLDPPNLTPPARYADRDRVLREMIRTLQGRIAIVHAKDFRLGKDGRGYELPGPLMGEMNYQLFAELIRSLPEDVPVIAEHIGPKEFAGTRRKLLEVLGS